VQELDAWTAAFVEIAPLVERSALRGEVMALALQRGEVDEKVQSRVLCCRLLGAIAPHLVRPPPPRAARQG
jgi:hypothetical protein